MTDHAADLAMFLKIEKGSVCARWVGRLIKAKQFELFGRYLGRGTIVINGATETVTHSRTVCFGTDFEVTHRLSWRELA